MKCIECSNNLTGNQIKFCSNKCKQKNHYNKLKSNPNTMWHQTKRAIDRKLYFVKQLGGKCSKCGYNRNITALHFHHKHSKSFPLSQRNLSNTSIKKLQLEINKCELLCANCHSEHHYPDFNYLL